MLTLLLTRDGVCKSASNPTIKGFQTEWHSSWRALIARQQVVVTYDWFRDFILVRDLAWKTQRSSVDKWPSAKRIIPKVLTLGIFYSNLGHAFDLPKIFLTFLAWLIQIIWFVALYHKIDYVNGTCCKSWFITPHSERVLVAESVTKNKQQSPKVQWTEKASLHNFFFIISGLHNYLFVPIFYSGRTTLTETGYQPISYDNTCYCSSLCKSRSRSHRFDEWCYDCDNVNNWFIQ